MVHVDIKKLGRIPDGGGHRALGRAKGRNNRDSTTAGPPATPTSTTPSMTIPGLHTPRSSPTREGNRSPVLAACQRLLPSPRDHGPARPDRQRILLSIRFSTSPRPGIKHKCTRPYRPQTNGKAERFNRTMLEEWAYARLPHRNRTSSPSPTGCTTTITNEATPHSRVNHPPAASPTSMGNTTR